MARPPSAPNVIWVFSRAIKPYHPCDPLSHLCAPQGWYVLESHVRFTYAKWIFYSKCMIIYCNSLTIWTSLYVYDFLVRCLKTTGRIADSANSDKTLDQFVSVSFAQTYLSKHLTYIWYKYLYSHIKGEGVYCFWCWFLLYIYAPYQMGGGYVILSADPVGFGFSIGIGVTISCLCSISWTG